MHYFVFLPTVDYNFVSFTCLLHASHHLDKGHGLRTMQELSFSSDSFIISAMKIQKNPKTQNIGGKK
jgi:hypothetical protein